MGLHKDAYTRYRVLDACLSNRRRRYRFNDLLDEVNEVLRELATREELENESYKVSERTLHDDIEHMKSEVLQSADVEIEKVYEGHTVYYRYSDPEFSLFNPLLSPEDIARLKETIEMLGRFKGLPQFDWIDETLARLRQTFRLDGTEAGMVSFTQNPKLNGLKWYGPLFEAIVQHQVIEVEYHRFGRKKRKRVIHPYQLRQWNNRWYVVGYEKRQEERFPYVVLPLDRVDQLRVKSEKFVPKPAGVDFDDYFYHIVGISLNPESKPEKVVIKAYYPAVWYMETKPIHPTQREVNENDNENEKGKPYKVFELTVIPNEELVQALIVYADQLEIEHEWVRNEVKKRAEKMLKLNS